VGMLKNVVHGFVFMYSSGLPSGDSWRVPAVVFIILFAFALIMWIHTAQSDMARINYCQSQYNSLQSRYYSLQSQYNTLSSNYTTLKNQYIILKNNLTTLTFSLGNLWNTLNSLGQYNIEDDTLKAGYYSVVWVVVPSGFTGTIHITMSSTSPLYLYVFNLNEFIDWVRSAGSPSSYIYYQSGNYIDYTLSEGPGLYFIVIYNPSNGDVTYSLTVTTTYTLISS
jgi:hypothetical protein